MKLLSPLLVTMRPAQWVKNLFVFAPALFAKAHTNDNPVLFLHALGAAGVFILLSGAVYTINDVIDKEKDELHPTKRNRPVASGRLPVPAAVTGGLVLLASAFITGSFLGQRFVATAAAYLFLNVAYSWYLKGVPWIDVIVIALGFLLRIVAGSFAIGLRSQEISVHLVICTFLVAWFLALGKRRHEIDVTGESGDHARKVLKHYTRRSLDVALWIVAGATVLSYVWYTIDPRTQQYFGNARLTWSIPFVLFGVLRFMMLVRRGSEGTSPTDVLVKDPWSLVNVAAWGITVVWAVYLS